jgi:hypothetical protein
MADQDKQHPGSPTQNPGQKDMSKQQSWDKNKPNQQQSGQEQKKGQQPEHNVHDQERKRA